MPLYEFKCSKCEYIFDQFLSVNNRENPLKDPCPKCGTEGTINKNLSAPPLTDPVRMGRIKAPAGFRDVLQNIHEKTPGSKLNIDRNIG